MLRRFTLLRLDGAVRATIAADLAGAQNVAPTFAGVLDDGRFVFRDQYPTIALKGQPNGERRDSLQYVILEPDGSWAGLRWKEPGPETYFRDANGSWDDPPLIFGRTTLETVAGGTLVVGSNDTLRLERVAADGSVLHAATLPWAPTPVTREWVEMERQRRMDEETEQTRRFVRRRGPSTEARAIANLEGRYRLLPHRPTLPAFSELRSDARGNIWVAEYAAPGATTRAWAVLDPLFEPVATIEIPSHFQILDLGATDLVGVTYDELGRATVGLWAILR